MNNQQQVFETVYRGRQSNLHHMAYMRMCKVLLTLRVLREFEFNLNGKSIFDYGFGAGTFFRFCPPNAHFYGVEMDHENVSDVTNMLRRRGYIHLDLQSIELQTWESHPLLQRSYDLFLCSHVLEHLPDPIHFLKVIHPCVGNDGVFLGLVPINEIADNPHHVQKVNEQTIRDWALQSGFVVANYIEADEILYFAQPLFTRDRGWRHKAAQAVSLALGIPANMMGEKLWWTLSGALGRFFKSQPTQAAFILRPR